MSAQDQLIAYTKQALDDLGLKPSAAERRFNLKEGTLNNLFRDRGVNTAIRPRVDTAEMICEALGLEFYIGPPRDAAPESAPPPEPQQNPWLKFSDTKTFPQKGFAKCSAQGWTKSQPVRDPLPAVESLDDPEAFYVTSIGQSMIPEGIESANTILVSPSSEFEEGDRVWILDWQGRAAIKRYLGEGSSGFGAFRGWMNIEDGRQKDFVEEHKLSTLRGTGKVVAVYKGRPGSEAVSYIPDPKQLQKEPAFQEAKSAISEDFSADYSIIKMHPLQQAVGDGWVPKQKDKLNAFAFPNYFLNHHGIVPSQASLLILGDDEMEPTLKNGTVVMLDHRKTTVKPKRVYAYMYQNAMECSRLEPHPAGMFIHRDNPKYFTELLMHDQLNDFEVIGEVVWSSRMESSLLTPARAK
jgi:phage repressor protein C with HTH and peptisase S24 domain